MNNQHQNTTRVTGQQLIDFYNKEAEIERRKKESREKAMDQQLAKITGGKNIIVSDKSYQK